MSSRLLSENYYHQKNYDDDDDDNDDDDDKKDISRFRQGIGLGEKSSWRKEDDGGSLLSLVGYLIYNDDFALYF